MKSKTINFDSLKQELLGCFCLTDQNVFDIYSRFLPNDTFVIPAGESSKSFDVVQKILQQMLKRSVLNTGKLAAIGGGVVGDIGGFCASIYKRGLDWICVPTTITAFADSSIGGKTGINAGGIKNSVGRIHPATLRLLCPEFLSTLPKYQIKDGMVEVYKTALLSRSLFDMIGTSSQYEMIIAAGKIKQETVRQDLFDKDKRRVLNMGHTLGHAIEATTGVSHGAAVATGLLLETIMCKSSTKQVLDFVKTVAQPYFNQIELNVDALTTAAKNDKKNSGGITIIAAKDIESPKEFEFSAQEFKQRLLFAISRYKD